MTDYDKAKEKGLTNINRWGSSMPHHPMSVRLVEFLIAHDYHDYDCHFDWEMGGDGDNGETLAFQMDAFFNLIDVQRLLSAARGREESLDPYLNSKERNALLYMLSEVESGIEAEQRLKWFLDSVPKGEYDANRASYNIATMTRDEGII